MNTCYVALFTLSSGDVYVQKNGINNWGPFERPPGELTGEHLGRLITHLCDKDDLPAEDVLINGTLDSVRIPSLFWEDCTLGVVFASVETSTAYHRQWNDNTERVEVIPYEQPDLLHYFAAWPNDMRTAIIKHNPRAQAIHFVSLQAIDESDLRGVERELIRAAFLRVKKEIRPLGPPPPPHVHHEKDRRCILFGLMVAGGLLSILLPRMIQ